MVDHLKPKVGFLPFRYGGTNLMQEWLVASPLTNTWLIPTIRDEQRETLEHIKANGIWVDFMYHEPVGEEDYLRITFKRGKNGRKIYE